MPRPQTFMLALLSLALFLASAAMVGHLSPPSGPYTYAPAAENDDLATSILAGLVVAQVVLAATYAASGAGNVGWRVLVPLAAIHVFGGWRLFVIAICVEHTFLGLVAIFAGVVAWLNVPVRQSECDQLQPGSRVRSRFRFSIYDMLSWTTVIALILGAAKYWYSPFPWSGVETAWIGYNAAVTGLWLAIMFDLWRKSAHPLRNTIWLFAAAIVFLAVEPWLIGMNWAVRLMAIACLTALGVLGLAAYLERETARPRAGIPKLRIIRSEVFAGDGRG